jgi:N-acetylmuramoyl-L-alanine amidase
MRPTKRPFLPVFRLLLVISIPALGLAAGGQAGTQQGEILGITIEPGERSIRLTVRCSAPARPTWRRKDRKRIVVDLPDTSASRLPEELPVDSNGIRSLRPRRDGTTTRLEFELQRPVGIRFRSPAGARSIVLEVGETVPDGPPSPPAARRVPVPAPGPKHPRTAPQPRPQPKPLTPPVKPEPGSQNPEGLPRLVQVTLVPRGSRVQVRLRTTGRARARHHYLRGATPRIFIDVIGAVLDAPTPPAVPPGTVVRAVRLGQNSESPPICRVVLELKAGTRANGIAPVGNSPGVLEFPNERGDGLTVLASVGASIAAATPRRSSPVRPRASRRYIIAVDAGHGGKDPGALGRKGFHEKRVTLDVALRLARYLRARGCQVRLSRSADSTLLPPQRSAWIKRTWSHLLVSIHCDSIGRPNISGATTYFHSGHAPSRKLAEQVQERLVRAARSPDLGVRSDFTRYSRGFYLLRNARRPAVLVETGYISHPATAKRFAQPYYRQRVAEGIGAGVMDYLRR